MAQILWAAFSLMIISGLVMLLINAYRLVRIKSLHKEYREYVQALVQGNPAWDFVRRPAEIKDLLIKADVGAPKLTRAEPLGLGQVHNFRMDVIDNMVKDDQEVVQHMYHLFYMAEGVFSYRIRQSINPIFWLETAIFLPSVIMGFVGFSATSSLAKLANATMWVLGAVGFVFALPDFYDLRDATSAFLADLLTSDTSK